ncbi:hypothetical protein RHGRI_009925 [Rhododendron griersonianum]|uniref:Leucine-rich repeat-containing N-terminal plant-type domain-containing protein n=1 Tax=Rhododendron griersonianum TaxID=479676 RepID=A0AAV6KGM2_9ERIC|nr:hypothetical protein RHGRI_009925 [Rhododendron griersonianum]
MSLLTKSLSIYLLALFLYLIPLLQIKTLALDTTTSLSLVNTINVASNETDFHALLAFKSNIFSEYQQALSSWNESLHFCHWDGVQCSRRHERVTAIYLKSRGLAGSLSPYVGNLSFLRELSLRNNTFTGLEKLSLTFNGFEGKIPTSLSRCSNLRILNVCQNKLVGEFPKEFVSNCSQLVQLELDVNNFSGKVRNDFRSLQNLRVIALSSNNFQARGSDGLAFFSSLTNCSNLKLLGLEQNQFGDVLPNFVGNLSISICWLLLNGNQFYGSIPSTIGNLVNMELLLLNDNLFTGPIPDSFGYLHKLRWLAFSNNKFSGEIPKSIGNLSMMNKLYLEKNRLEGAIPSSLGDCQNLLEITLNENNLNGSIPRQLLIVSSLSIALDLSRNRLSGSLPPEVGYLKNLAKIDISENVMSGEIPGSLGSCNSLENLYLQQNSFQGSIPSSMESLRGIQNLDFLTTTYPVKFRASWGLFP